MNDLRQQLLKWLEQAYTMEKESEALLGALEGQLTDYASLRNGVALHREQTVWQARKIEDCLHLAGGTVALIKSTATAAIFNLHSSLSLAVDADISRALALTQAFEQWEMSNYKAIIIASRALDDMRIADACHEILKQEREMVTWLSRQHEMMVNARCSATATH